MKATHLIGVGLGLAVLALAGPLAHPFGRVDHTANPDPLFAGSQVPSDVLATFEGKCADCHSERTRWPLYSHVAPAAWLLERDIHEGREHLDASRWQDYTPERQEEVLGELGRQARNRTMPPSQYTLIHRDAKLTAEEAERIVAWTKAERHAIREKAVQP